MKKIKAYKVFNSDWTCKNFQFEIGKSYTIDERRNELLGKGYVIKSMGVDGLGVFIDFHKKDTNCYRKVYSTKRGEACLPPKNDFVTREYLYDDYLIITGACDEFKSAE